MNTPGAKEDLPLLDLESSSVPGSRTWWDMLVLCLFAQGYQK